MKNYWPVIVLLVLSLAFGLVGSSLVRPFFIVGCIGVGYYTKRHPLVHFQTTIILFCFTPLLRRVTDQFIGFDPLGILLTGSFCTVIPVMFDFHVKGLRQTPTAILMLCACVIYGAFITILENEFSGAASGIIKWMFPVIYGLWLSQKQISPGRLFTAFADVSAFVMPILGVYAIVQFIFLPEWDRLWMINYQMWSIGQPEPYLVRVFSTMNSPASFATYMVAGLMAMGVSRFRFSIAIVGIPCMIGLLLSLYRTAWTGLLVGLVVLLISPLTRKYVIIWLLVGGLVGCFIIANPYSEISEAISLRFESFSSGSEDGSLVSRLDEYGIVFNDRQSLIGHGFALSSDGDILTLDGQMAIAWYTMGLPVALFYLAALMWCGWCTLSLLARTVDVLHVLAGGMIAGLIAQLPFATIATGEMGFLFWPFVCTAIGQSRVQPHAARVLAPWA